MTKIGTFLCFLRIILMENANTALDELKMIVSGMDTKASQLAVKRIKEILDENPQIVNEACRHIEVFFKDVIRFAWDLRL